MKHLNVTKKYMCSLRKNIQKTLKVSKITVGLTLDEYLYQIWWIEMCPYGTYVLLGSLKHVLRGRKLNEKCSKGA